MGQDCQPFSDLLHHKKHQKQLSDELSKSTFSSVAVRQECDFLGFFLILGFSQNLPEPSNFLEKECAENSKSSTLTQIF